MLGNHNNPRVATRVGLGQARAAAMLILILRGTPTLYYGDEIEMRDVHFSSAAAQDPWEKNVPGLGRDPARTPMPWDAGLHAGFTTGAPWLPVAKDFPRVNVAAQRSDTSSLLHLYRRLLSLRAAEPALQTGRYAPVMTDERVLAYTREQILVMLNFASEPVTVNHNEVQGRITLSTGLDQENEAVSGALRLRGDEGVIISIH